MTNDPFTEDFDGISGFDNIAFDEENLFEVPVYPVSPQQGSVTNAMDDMDISDNEIDLTEKLPDVESYSIKKTVERMIVDYTQVPDTGAFISATCPTTGVSLFFSKKTPAELKRKQKTLNDEAIKKNRKSLLTKPLWQLRKEIERNNQEELKRIEKWVCW